VKRIKRFRTSAILPTESEPLNDFSQSEDSPSFPVSGGDRSMLARVGGFDGIMSMMGKVQQFFGIFQQIRPAFKMAGSLFGTKAFLSGVPSSRVKSKNKKAKLKSRAAAASRQKTSRKRSSR
jgi:hypothetical protein